MHSHLALVHGNLRVPKDGVLATDEASSFVCSVAYVVSWHSKAHGTVAQPENKVRGPGDEQAQFFEQMRRMGMQGQQGAQQMLATPTLKVPIHDVFAAYQRQRGVVMRWEAAASRDELDAVLGRVVGVALQRENLVELEEREDPAWRGWQRQTERPLICERVIESPHPYKPSVDEYEEVRFPGAPYIAIYFDERSNTEYLSDYVTIYKGDVASVSLLLIAVC